MLRLLLLALLVACTKPKTAPDAGTGTGSGGVDAGWAAAASDGLTTCVRVAIPAPLAEVGKTCGRAGLRAESEGPRCNYRLAEHPQAWLRFTLAGRGTDAYEAARRRLATVEPSPAPTLGPKGLFFYDRLRSYTGVLFEAGGEVVTLEASAAFCAIGPLLRIARLFYERSPKASSGYR